MTVKHLALTVQTLIRPPVYYFIYVVHLLIIKNILTHLACRANVKIVRYIKQQLKALKARGKCDSRRHLLLEKMTSFMALDGVTSFLRLKDVTNTCKRMRRGLSIGGSFQCKNGKLEKS